MVGHVGAPTNVGETQSGLLEIWFLASRSSRNWTQNETNGTPSGRIIFKYFICQIEVLKGYPNMLTRQTIHITERSMFDRAVSLET